MATSTVDDLLKSSPYSFTRLDCNSTRYPEFRFSDSFFLFLVSCQSIERYLVGHRVTFKIGNPYSFNFSNVKGLLRYGKTITDVFKQEIGVSSVETLRGGTWQTFVITINPSKPEDLRELWLELNAETAAATR